MSYNALGYLTGVSVGGASLLTYSYDLSGNRVRQQTVQNGTTVSSYYAYDALNRQTMVDGVVDNDVNNSANIASARGRRVFYDLNGNRTGENTATHIQTYQYDALNRLVKVTQNGSTLRYFKYDRADRILESFDRSEADQTQALHYTNIYDSQGRLVRQYHRAKSSIDSSNVIATGIDDSVTYNTYDAYGNLTRSVNQMFGEHLYLVTTNTTFAAQGDSYVQSSIVATRSDNVGNPGQTTYTYDRNNFLKSITDKIQDTNNRDFITDVTGQVLQKTQQGNTLRNLVVNGQVLGTYGVGVDEDKPPVISKVKVKIVMHINTQRDGATSTSEYSLTYWAGDVNASASVTGMANGSETSTTLAGVPWPPHNDSLTIVLKGREVDPSAPDDSIPDATLNIATSDWTMEGQTFTSGTFSNGTVSYYIKATLYADTADRSYSDTVFNFNSSYQELDAAHPGSGPDSYQVRAGDTLQGIAYATYGDRSFWYLIADANGLRANAELRPGLLLKLPATVGTVHNSNDTIRPYEVSRIVGDTSPTLATPTTSSNTCKTVGIIIAAVIAAVIITALAAVATVATLGAFGVPAMTSAGVAISLLFGAVGGALGSMASQGIMVAGGVQDKMDWKKVAIDTMAGALANGISSVASTAATTASTASRAALSAARAAQLAKVSRVMGASLKTAWAARKVGAGAVGKELGLLGARLGANAALEGGSDMAVQYIAYSSGLQDQFNWSEVGESAIGGAIGGPLSREAIAENAVLAMTGDAAEQAGKAAVSHASGPGKVAKLARTIANRMEGTPQVQAAVEAIRKRWDVGLGASMGAAKGAAKGALSDVWEQQTDDRKGMDYREILVSAAFGTAVGVGGALGARKFMDGSRERFMVESSLTFVAEVASTFVQNVVLRKGGADANEIAHDLAVSSGALILAATSLGQYDSNEEIQSMYEEIRLDKQAAIHKSLFEEVRTVGLAQANPATVRADRQARTEELLQLRSRGLVQSNLAVRAGQQNPALQGQQVQAPGRARELQQLQLLGLVQARLADINR